MPEPVPGEPVCTIQDHRLVELSGMETVDDGFIVINDSQELPERLPIFFLNHTCEVVDQILFPPRPRDPEALALDRERNLLWVGDVGDNVAGGMGEGSPRDTVALWQAALNAADRTPVIHRFVYPDGEPRDAEALILDGDGTPVIITKAVGTAELYRPTDMVANNPPEQAVPLEKVGEFTPPETDTPHDLFPAAVAQRVITGGANSPDGSRVVLRSYTDAFEFDVADGDVIGAITEGEPRITPLPGEPQGEAITYSSDGEHFLTVSEIPAEQQAYTPVILRYTPTEPAPPAAEEPAEEPAASEGGSALSLNRIMLLVGLVGVLGLIMAAVGVFGIVRARRKAREANDPGPVSAAVSVSAGGGTVYSAAARSAPPGDGPAEGWEPDVPQPEAPGVYRSSGYGGTEYGSGQSGGGVDYPAADYGGMEYGAEYGGAGYGAEYGGDAYQSEGYPVAGYAYPSQYDDDMPYAGWGHGDGSYQADPQVDDYYDDPDYQYEFRDPGTGRH